MPILLGHIPYQPIQSSNNVGSRSPGLGFQSLREFEGEIVILWSELPYLELAHSLESFCQERRFRYVDARRTCLQLTPDSPEVCHIPGSAGKADHNLEGDRIQSDICLLHLLPQAQSPGVPFRRCRHTRQNCVPMIHILFKSRKVIDEIPQRNVFGFLISDNCIEVESLCEGILVASFLLITKDFTCSMERTALLAKSKSRVSAAARSTRLKCRVCGRTPDRFMRAKAFLRS